VRDTLFLQVTAVGAAQALRTLPITTQVAGELLELVVGEGSIVNTGDIVARIDAFDYDQALEQAQASYQQAQLTYQQATIALADEPDLALRAKLDSIARITSGLVNQENALERAQRDLDRTTVRAPFGGLVSDVVGVENSQVGTGAALFTLNEMNPIRVDVNVLEARIPEVEVGRRAELTFAAFPGRVFSGTIGSINPVVDANQSSGRVTILLPNPRYEIKPGMFATATIEARAIPDVILVPKSAPLQKDEDRWMVFVEEGGFAMWTYITTGRSNDRFIEIVPSEEGELLAGQIVLSDGHRYLAHQAAVRISNDPDSLVAARRMRQ
jgi:membrane fusion protein (multidrug efflux system)